MDTVEAVDLLGGYDRWKKDIAQREPDSSPRAYVAHRKNTELLNRLRDAANEATMHIVRLRRALDEPGLRPEEKDAIGALLLLAEIVREAE